MNSNVWAVCVILCAAFPCVSLAQAPPEAAPSARWEIKGIRLGASRAEIEALVPSLACKPADFDDGLSTCIDPNATLAEKTALLRVRLLDGKVVLVELAHLRPKQTRVAAEALVQKFGLANRISDATYRPAFGDHVVRDKKHIWEDAGIQLVVDPLEPKPDGTYPEGTVFLVDVAKYDGEWMGRFRTKGKGRNAADAIGL